MQTPALETQSSNAVSVIQMQSPLLMNWVQVCLRVKTLQNICIIKLSLYFLKMTEANGDNFVCWKCSHTAFTPNNTERYDWWAAVGWMKMWNCGLACASHRLSYWPDCVTAWHHKFYTAKSAITQPLFTDHSLWFSPKKTMFVTTVPESGIGNWKSSLAGLDKFVRHARLSSH